MDRLPELRSALAHAERFMSTLPDRPVASSIAHRDLRARFDSRLPESGEPPEHVIECLAEAAEPGLVASQSGRFFGFVIGGAHPASLAADWLVSAWDQNVGFYILSPTSSVAEEIVSDWVLDLLDLPAECAVGFVTGCQMANFMGLACGRQSALARSGWNAAREGLLGAPPVRVIAGAEAHGTIDRALAMLGLGSARIERVRSDAQGRMEPEALEALLSQSGTPAIVCAQAGNVNTGAFDPFEEIVPICRASNAWLHVDGAFGLWAAASRDKRHLTAGIAGADSWATDAHKWLNVPYDSGLVIVRDPELLIAATDYPGDYLVRSKGMREPCSFTPESSRRARAIPIYAALRELGRSGVEDLVDRCCAHARRAARLLEAGGAEILNEVMLNQVMARFEPPVGVDANAFMDDVISRIQRDGTCWVGGTTRGGVRAIRVSVCNRRTTEADIEASVSAVLRCVEGSRAAGGETRSDR